MTGQSRLMSLVEAILNIGIGYGLAVLTQTVVLPIFGVQAAFGRNCTADSCNKPRQPAVCSAL